jgi:hypothetical protein
MARGGEMKWRGEAKGYGFCYSSMVWVDDGSRTQYTAINQSMLGILGAEMMWRGEALLQLKGAAAASRNRNTDNIPYPSARYKVLRQQVEIATPTTYHTLRPGTRWCMSCASRKATAIANEALPVGAESSVAIMQLCEHRASRIISFSSKKCIVL